MTADPTVVAVPRAAPPAGRPLYRRVPRTPALDGLRALAIAAVALFHYPTHLVFKGGLFGVGLFFVLSGFLVTPILATGFQSEGRVRVGPYLSRRAWRLLPALLAFLVILVAMTAAFGRTGWFASTPFGPTDAPGGPVSFTRTLGGAAAAVTYVYNLLLAHSVRMPQPFGHLWTLSVEGQFYLGWALLMAWLLRRGPRLTIAVTAGLIAVSAAVPFLAWTPAGNHDWIYFSTVPRIQQLLAGALLAQLWSLGLLARVPRAVVRGAAFAGAGAMVYMVLCVGNDQFKYVGALTAVAASGFVVIAHLVDDRGPSWSRSLLGSEPLVWLGQRSYAIYLWHWPLALWTNELPNPVGVPLGLAATLVAAELSWRLVERPAADRARRRLRRGILRSAGTS